MARPRQDASPWTLALLKLLEDGEWRDYRDVLREVSPLVPPAVAFRKAEYFREYHYKSKGEEVRERSHGDRNDTIKTGQRYIVGRTIAALRRHGRIEVEYAEGTGKRKRPQRVRRVDALD